jgi:hypothetical protein
MWCHASQFAPNGRHLRVRAAKRSLIPAGRADFAPDALPLRVHRRPQVRSFGSAVAATAGTPAISLPIRRPPNRGLWTIFLSKRHSRGPLTLPICDPGRRRGSAALRWQSYTIGHVHAYAPLRGTRACPAGVCLASRKMGRSRNGMRKLRTGDSARGRRSGRQLIAGCRNNAMSTFQQKSS